MDPLRSLQPWAPFVPLPLSYCYQIRQKELLYEGYIPARYVLSFLCFCAMSLEFAHRVCLSVTIVAMVNHTALESPNDTDSGGSKCPSSPSNNITLLDEMGTYVWSPSVQGVILGAYFYGFVLTQLVGGRVAEIAGGKWLLGSAIFSASLLTMATPFAADLGVAAIVCLRIVMGLIHGVCLPAVFAMLARWAPDEERSTLIALCIVGDHVGTVLSMPLAGYLCDNGFAGGWPSVFYVLGALGCIWFWFWCWLVYSSPVDHPRISRQELEYIRNDWIDIAEKQKLPIAWKKVLTSMPVWALIAVSFAAAWGHTTLLTKLPAYLELRLHVPIQKNGLMNSMVYVVICVTLFASGYASDYMRSKKQMSATKVRKYFEFFAMVGPAVCTALIPVVGCNKKAAIFLLTAAMAFLGLCGGGHVSMAADLAPHHSATVFGLVNTIGCTAGIFSPLTAGLLLDSGHSSEQWNLVFYISSIFYGLGALIFMVWASAEPQPWTEVTCTLPGIQYGSINDGSFHQRSYCKDLEASFKYSVLT